MDHRELKLDYFQLFELSLVLTLLSLAVTVNAEDKPVISFKTEKALYVHAVSGSDDTESWSAWQCVHDLKNAKINENEKYFFLPSSADSAKADIYNAYSESVTVNGTKIRRKQRLHAEIYEVGRRGGDLR